MIIRVSEWHYFDTTGVRWVLQEDPENKGASILVLKDGTLARFDLPVDKVRESLHAGLGSGSHFFDLWGVVSIHKACVSMDEDRLGKLARKYCPDGLVARLDLAKMIDEGAKEACWDSDDLSLRRAQAFVKMLQKDDPLLPYAGVEAATYIVRRILFLEDGNGPSSSCDGD
jgi:hypothetical protein